MNPLNFRNRQLGLLLVLSICLTGCNPEEYFPVQENILGDDNFCAPAVDLAACRDLGSRCLPAYTEASVESTEPIFDLCVANPDYNDDGDTTTGGSDGGTDTPPTLDDTHTGKCLNLDEKYLWIKETVADKKTDRMVKIKVCHMTGNGSSHTIVIACPAVKAHARHDDYIGTCHL